MMLAVEDKGTHGVLECVCIRFGYTTCEINMYALCWSLWMPCPSLSRIRCPFASARGDITTYMHTRRFLILLIVQHPDLATTFTRPESCPQDASLTSRTSSWWAPPRALLLRRSSMRDCFGASGGGLVSCAAWMLAAAWPQVSVCARWRTFAWQWPSNRVYQALSCRNSMASFMGVPGMALTAICLERTSRSWVSGRSLSLGQRAAICL